MLYFQANQIPVSARVLDLGSASISLQWVGREEAGTVSCSVFSLADGQLTSSTLHLLTVLSPPVITDHSGESSPHKL